MRRVLPSSRCRGASFQIEELEPRLLFSADAATLLGLPVTLAAPAESARATETAAADATAASIPVMQAVVTSPSAAETSSVRHELVFVDASVPDADQLIDGIKADATPDKLIEVVVIQAGEDGLAVITKALQQRHDLDAVHIISHGDASGLQLGATRLDSASLNEHLGDVAGWGTALSQEADLLLYGCDLTSTSGGQALVDNLALLTGADVAASKDLTGSAALGGNWLLEYQHGQIESTVVVDGSLASTWNHTLATTSFQDGTGGYTSTTDTFLELLGPANNNSADTTLSAGRATTQNGFQTLVKFEDIIGASAGQIPQGSVITSVTLTMYMTSSPTFTNPTFSLYRMLAAWTDTSTYASMGDGIDGAEYKFSADQTITDSGAKSYTFASNAAMIATVQAWVNNPSSNQGWYLFCDDNSSQASFASAENATVANRPKLSVTYTQPTPQTVDLDANNSSGATGSNYTGAFTEQTPVKIADTDATISGGTATNLTSMTVTLTNPLDGALESLSATNTGNITSSYNSGTGVLTLSGSDTVANYQTVLRSITYNNTSDNPNTTSRTFNVVATDSNGTTTNTATTTLSVTRVNDAPVISSNGGGASGSVNAFENQTAVTTVTATDADSGALTYSISGGADAAKFTIDATTGVMTFITAPNFDSPGDVGANNVYDVIVRVTDGSLADTQALAVTVLNVNEVPIGTSKTVTTNEDTAYTFTVADFGFTDPNDSPANTLLSVKITTLPAAGSLTLNGVAVTVGQFVSAANIASGLLKFTPAANANGAGYASFTFQVQDNGGTANGGVNLDATPRTMTVDVTAVNDAPVGTNTTVTTLEDTAYTFSAADFGFTDPNDTPANTLSGVKITALPATGSLTLNGVAVTAGQVISAANIASGLLKFTPASNANGAGNASFTFQVQDNGG
ncbi:DUF4347 domain-containing protein, partial [Aquabacterium sp.]|uniref:DUF4347 domain-containing protein n=1 Tax=Aquabacterium sp. TaxID=1872578 RepID=UPI003D6D5C9E